MNKYELVVNDCIDKGNCLTNYIPVYQWFCYDKISNEIWEQFCLTCLEELQAVSAEVARETATPVFPDKIKIEIKF